MANIPKIVRDRLLAPESAAAVNHPEADVLTAFSERLLPQAERDHVLEHLSRCGECREIVALALPENESNEHAIPASRARFAWPEFRWAFIAAGLAAILIVGVLQYQLHVHKSGIAYNKPQSPPALAKTETPRAAETGAEATQQEARLAIPNPAADTKTRGSGSEYVNRDKTSPIVVGVKPPRSSTSRSIDSHGPMQTNVLEQMNSNNSVHDSTALSVDSMQESKRRSSGTTSNAPVPASTEMVEVQGQSASVNSQLQNTETLLVGQQAGPPQPMPGGHAETDVTRAKSLTASSPKTMAESGALQRGGSFKDVGVNPRWTINSAGGLQRSFDDGASWQDVNINTSPGYAGGGRLSSTAAPPPKAKSLDTSVTGAEKKEQSMAPVFRAVAANGPDVWAGGSAGLLCHSSDGGSHWTRVVPTVNGSALTGDIVSLNFPNPVNGKLTTTAGETWTTADGGLSWGKQ